MRSDRTILAFTVDQLIDDVFTEFEQFKADYGESSDSELIQDDDGLRVEQTRGGSPCRYQVLSNESIRAIGSYSKSIIAGSAIQTVNFDPNNICSIIALTAYLLYRKKSWNDINVSPGVERSIEQSLSKLVEPVDHRFLSQIDFNDEGEILSALFYTLYITPIKHSQEHISIEPSTAITRISECLDSDFFRLRKRPNNINIAITVLTGLFPMSDSDILTVEELSVSNDDIEKAFPFFLFMSESQDEDVYHVGQSYGNWKILPLEDSPLRFTTHSKHEIDFTTACADGLTKEEIKRRIFPLYGFTPFLLENTKEALISAIKTRTFAVPDFPIEETSILYAETSKNLRKTLENQQGKNYKEYLYSDAMKPITACFLNVIRAQSSNSRSQARTIDEIFELFKLRLYASYAKEFQNAAQNTIALMKAVQRDAFDVENKMSFLPNQLLSIEIMIRASVLTETMNDAEIAELFITMSRFHKDNSKRLLNLDEWIKMAEFMKNSGTKLYDWAYAATIDN